MKRLAEIGYWLSLSPKEKRQLRAILKMTQEEAEKLDEAQCGESEQVQIGMSATRPRYDLPGMRTLTLLNTMSKCMPYRSQFADSIMNWFDDFFLDKGVPHQAFGVTPELGRVDPLVIVQGTDRRAWRLIISGLYGYPLDEYMRQPEVRKREILLMRTRLVGPR